MIGAVEKKILINILNSQTSISNLSKDFNLSERSIRYKIQNLNEFFKDENITGNIFIKHGNINYIGDTSILHEKHLDLTSSNYVFSQEERLEYLKISLLFSSDKFVFEDAIKELDISLSTFKKDWKLLRQDFNSLGIDIKNTKYQTKLISDEDKLRSHLLNYLIKYKVNLINLEANKSFMEKNLASHFKNYNFLPIIDFLNKISLNLEKTISDEAFKILSYYITIIILRNKNNSFDFSPIKNKFFLSTTKEYQILKKEITTLEKEYSFQLKEEEQYILTEYLLGSHSYNLEYSFYENWVKIDESIITLISDVSKELSVDLTKDVQLFEEILNHIRPMIYRIKRGIKFKNSIFHDLKEKDRLIFSILKNSIKILEDFIEEEIDEEEVAYLVIFFKLALERAKKKLKKRVVIVCSFGYGISKVLEVRLKEEFNISIVDVLPLNKLNSYSFKDKEIDVIITTVNLKDKFNLPTIKVDPLLNSDTLIKLQEIGLQKTSIDITLDSLFTIIEENCEIHNEENLKNQIFNLFGHKQLINKSNIGDNLSSYLKPNNLKIVNEVKSWEEAISLAGETLVKEGYINPSYVKKSIEIIREQGPYMLIGPNILLPHSDDFKNVKKTGYSYLKLNKPVLIEDEDSKFYIENIFFLASIDGQEHRSSLLTLKKMIDHHNLIEILKEEKSLTNIYKKIIDLENTL